MLRRFLDILNLALAAGYLILLLTIPAQFWDVSFPLGSGPEIEAVIMPGKTAMEISYSFQEQGVVDDAYGLAHWLAHFKIDRSLKPGMYTIKRGTPWEVAKQLIYSKPSLFRFTIIPGTGRSYFSSSFGETVSPSLIETALSDNENYPEELRAILPENTGVRLSLLLPETYVCPTMLPDCVVQQASSLWLKKIKPHINLSGISDGKLHDLAVIASLIEKEARIDTERPIISGVIYNRLKKNMHLQIDATVVYAWARKGKPLKRVLYKDLEVDSPFNTYRNKGLPPEPICIPSLPSWLAAVNPQENNYLYYVAGKDGKHIFSTSYKEHLKAVKKTRKER